MSTIAQAVGPERARTIRDLFAAELPFAPAAVAPKRAIGRPFDHESGAAAGRISGQVRYRSEVGHRQCQKRGSGRTPRRRRKVVPIMTEPGDSAPHRRPVEQLAVAALAGRFGFAEWELAALLGRAPTPLEWAEYSFARTLARDAA